MLKYLPFSGFRVQGSGCKLSLVVFLVLFYLMFPQTAYAYLDPGSGSFILQLIIGALFGLLLAGKVFWGRIKVFFKNLFSRPQDSVKKKKGED